MSLLKQCQDSRAPPTMIFSFNVVFPREALSTSRETSPSAVQTTASTETIFEIFASKQICRRDRDGPNLMKRKDGEPELEMTFQNEHYLVSALNSEITEIICCHISKFCDITECEITLSSIFRHVKHRQFIRTFFCHYVNYII